MRFPAYFWGEILKNLLQFLFQSGMLYPTKAKLGYIFSLERQLRLRMRLCFYLAIFFIYLLIIYPACPARDEKSDDPPARVVAFSFARRGAEYKPPKHCSTDDVPQLLFPVPPQKVCLNKHTCFFLTSLCMRVILIFVN
jgi:hypothetical protein